MSSTSPKQSNSSSPAVHFLYSPSTAKPSHPSIALNPAPAPRIKSSLRTTLVMPPRPPAPSRDLLRTLRSIVFRDSCSQASTCARRPRSHHPLRTLTTFHARSEPNRPGARNPYAPRHHDRGPPSTEDTQTDFSKMDIFNTSSTPTPATSIDACTSDGFHLNNGIKTTGRKGVLLVGGECFVWDPWAAATAAAGSSNASPSTSISTSTQPQPGADAELVDARGTLSIPPSAFALLDLLHPKPDLLLLGTGAKLWMLSKSTRDYLSGTLGVRVDVMDTGNASAAYNLLAQERGVEGGGGVGAALLPLGWVGTSR